MTWQTNALLYFSDDTGTTWHKISDHNRQPLNITINRIGTDNRMVNGRLRRFAVAKKRQFTTSWTDLPALTSPGGSGLAPVDNGFGALDIKDWHDTHDGAFLVKLRKGQDIAKTAGDGTIETVNVMITDFSADVNRRGANQDLYNVSLTFEEV